MKNNEKMISESLKGIIAQKQKIFVQCTYGKKEINAYCFNNFAYHKSLDDDYYSVVHIPTGLKVPTKCLLNRKKAKELTFRFWNVEDKYDVNMFGKFCGKVRKVLKDFEERNPILFEESEFHFKEKDFQIK